MPYTPPPSQFSPSNGFIPDKLYEKPAAPAATPSQTYAAASKPATKPLLSRLSIYRHNVEPDRVFSQLFGKEMKVDEHTGIVNLVPGTK